MMIKIETKINSIKVLTNGLLNYADSFSFVIREENKINQNIRNLLNDLSTFLIEEKEVGEWPGTKLLLGYAKLYMFRLNKMSALTLYKQEDNLFNWVQHELPEDLVFYKNNKAIFTSITHENDAYFELDLEGIKILNLNSLSLLK